MMALVFKYSEAGAQHYVLSKDHILPFVNKSGAQPPLSSSHRTGAFGSVRPVFIHRQHYDFGPYNVCVCYLGEL